MYCKIGLANNHHIKMHLFSKMHPRSKLPFYYAGRARRCLTCYKGVQDNTHFYNCQTINVEWMTDVPRDERTKLGHDVVTCFREAIERSPLLKNGEITTWDLS